MSGAWEIHASGARVTARLTPKSSRDAIDGVEHLADGTAVLKARVRAAPEDGKANDALRRLLAKSMGVPASAVTLTRGAASRIKIFDIAGDPQGISARLASLANKP